MINNGVPSEMSNGDRHGHQDPSRPDMGPQQNEPKLPDMGAALEPTRLAPITGHLVRGLNFLTPDGVETNASVFFSCEHLNTLSVETLRRQKAHPPLRSCGRHSV